MRILVAGEQRELGESLLPFLARKGYTLLFVRTADEFIERVRAESFDLIIIDLDLQAEDVGETEWGPSGNLNARDRRCRKHAPSALPKSTRPAVEA